MAAPATAADPNAGELDTPRYRVAFERLLAEMDALEPSALIKPNIELQQTVTLVIGSLPEIMAMRGAIATQLPAFDLDKLDKLEAYTLVAGHSQALFAASSDSARIEAALVAEATQLRATLFSDCQALAFRGLIDGGRLKGLKGPIGFENIAFDLMSLSEILRSSWSNIVGRTAVQLEELDRAARLSDELITSVGIKEQSESEKDLAIDRRQRAFTLFLNAYEEVRDAIWYLRRKQGDGPKIAPSLYTGRTGRSSSPQQPPASDTTPATPERAVAQSGFAPAMDAGDAEPLPIAVGLPGARPYEK